MDPGIDHFIHCSNNKPFDQSNIQIFANGSFLLAMFDNQEFLTPLLGKGELGSLFSAGTLPLLYVAVGLKVGSELAGLLAHLSESEASD